MVASGDLHYCGVVATRWANFSDSRGSIFHEEDTHFSALAKQFNLLMAEHLSRYFEPLDALDDHINLADSLN